MGNKKIITLLFVLFFLKICYGQTYCGQKIEYAILEVNNKLLDSIFYKIISIETQYCDLTPEISYFVACQIIDSAKFNLNIKITTIEKEVVFMNNLAYGIYLVNNHVFFIHKSMDYFFKTTINSKIFKKNKKKILDQEKTILINDGYKTTWFFEFNSNTFILKSYSTHNFLQLLYNDPFNINFKKKEPYKIDIIPDEPSEFPK